MIKKTLLNTVIASCLLVSSSAFALDITINGNKTVTTDEVEQVMAQQNIVANDSVALAKLVLSMYQQKGMIGVKIDVNKQTGVITVTERVIKNGGGKYSEYFPDVITPDLKVIQARLKSVLDANNERVNLVISDGKNKNEAILKIDVIKTNGKENTGSLTITNIGSKYTSSMMMTGQMEQKLGNGMVVDATISEGISGLSDDSKGGDLTVLDAGFTKHSFFGSTTLQATSTKYKVGGEYEDFGVSGSSSNISLKHKYILNNEVVLIGGLNAYFSDSSIDSGNLNSGYDYRSVFAEAKVTQSNMQITANIEHGLNGAEIYNVAPIHGSFDSTFTTLKIDGKHVTHVQDVSITSKLGFQNSTDGTPSDKRFAVGGKDRGSSFSSGFVSLKSGAYGSITASKKVDEILVSGGIDGAFGTSMTDERHSVASAFIGAKHFSKKHNIYLDGQLSKNIGADLENQDEYKLSIIATKLF